jgi:Glycosyl transferases group 1
MKILIWHVHGSWTTAFVQGRHQYLVPVIEGRGPDGLGRARTWDWPATVRELTPQQLRAERADLVVLQRPHEAELLHRWCGMRAGLDVPAVYVEHNAPEPHPVLSRHVLADRSDIPIVHVTAFNALMWDSGAAPTRVIEHGIVDPGHRYTGELARVGVVINEPARRGRMVGSDLVQHFARDLPIDVFGMTGADASAATGIPGTTALGDVPQAAMHSELARRRVYLHPVRWTSLGLSLIEAMQLGMPVVALATTAVTEAVPAQGGVVSSDPAVVQAALVQFLADAEAAQLAGKAARSHALERFGLARFLTDWDRLIKEVVS